MLVQRLVRTDKGVGREWDHRDKVLEALALVQMKQLV